MVLAIGMFLFSNSSYCMEDSLRVQVDSKTTEVRLEDMLVLLKSKDNKPIESYIEKLIEEQVKLKKERMKLRLLSIDNTQEGRMDLLMV